MKLYGLLGCGIEKSLSKELYNAAFRALGESAVFVNLDIQKYELDEMLECILKSKFGGFAITSPFKEAIVPYLKINACHDSAINCVNIYEQREYDVRQVPYTKQYMYGYNTDITGLRYALDIRGETLKGRTVAVLGSSAMAVQIVLQMEEAERFTIYGRNQDKLNRIFQRITSRNPDAKCSVKLLSEGISEHVIINTISEDIPMDFGQAHEFFIDLKYRKKSLALKAAAQKMMVMDGLDMLVGQAAQNYSLWFPKTNHREILSIMDKVAKPYQMKDIK
jgi:shikimate dehydrogenase